MSFAYNPLSLSGSAGGGSGSGRTTVGASGASYTSIAAAISGNANVLSVITDVTESDVVQVPDDGLDIFIENDSTLTMGTNTFNVGSYGLIIGGHGTLAFENAGTLFSGVAGAELFVEGITIDNNASQDVCITNIDYARFSNVIFDGSIKICGDSNSYSSCIYKNGTLLVGSGISNTSIDGGILESMVVSNSGTNTVMSDLVVY